MVCFHFFFVFAIQPIIHFFSNRWLGGVMVRRSGRYQVVTTWMGDCLWTGKPSRYMTNTKVNLAFYPFEVGKSSTGLHGWG